MNHSAPASDSDRPGPRFLFPLVSLVWILIFVFAASRYRGPAYKMDDVPADEFSGARAYKILDNIVGDEKSHESGSEQNQIVRQRIVEQFEKMGYQVELQQGIWVQHGNKQEIALTNLIARLKGKNHGTPDQRTIIALSHYDSKPGANGVADNGVGVAAGLEIARMLKKESGLNHDVLFVVTDGEEFGLLGAKGFVNEHPYAKECDVVINLEARGTSGPSLMFETNADNAYAIPILNRAIGRPFCSSLFFEIYRKLPNDTDFTVFREAGYAGYNFAFIGDVRYYHTPEDCLQNLDPKSLQHHGDNLLGLIRELDHYDQFRPDENEAQFVVYSDFYGFWIYYWPHRWSWLLLLLGLAAQLFVFRLLVGRRQPSESSETTAEPKRLVQRLDALAKLPIFRGAQNLMLMLLIMAASVCSLHYGLWSGDALTGSWVNDAVFVEASYWLIVACSMFVLAWLTDQRESIRQTYLAVVILWVVIGLISIVWLPGACYLLIVPLLISGILSLFAAAFWKQKAAVPVYLAFTVSVALIWLPMEQMFYDAVGFKMQMILMVRVILVSTSLIPIVMITRTRWIPVYATGLMVLGFASSLFSVIWT